MIPGGAIKNAQGEVQYEHGAPNTKITTQTGAKKTRASTKAPVGRYQYPEHRTVADSEDTLLIKAIEYIPPSDTVAGKGRTGGSV